MNITKSKKKSSSPKGKRKNNPNIFSEVEESILHLLSITKSDFSSFDSEFKKLKKDFGEQIYSTFLYLISNLQFTNKEAMIHYNAIKKHHKEMSSLLGRNVDIRVAVADYFVSNKEMIKNPVILEIHLYKKTFSAGIVDSLTNLYNYSFLKGSLPHELAHSKRFSEPLSIIFFDIDNFKKINDTLGHEKANYFLKKFGGILKSSIREMDLPFRYGGEEFVLILPRTEKFGALAVGERIRKSFMNLKNEESNIEVTVSGGISSFPVDDDDSNQLLKKADEAMYRAKARGKNRIELYSTERRHFERFEDNFKGLITISSRKYEILGKNISLNGFYFETERRFRKSSHLKFLIEFKGLKPIIGEGKVTRVEQHPNRIFGVGALITSISKENRDLLSNHIFNLMSKIE